MIFRLKCNCVHGGRIRNVADDKFFLVNPIANIKCDRSGNTGLNQCHHRGTKCWIVRCCSTNGIGPVQLSETLRTHKQANN